MMIRLILIIIIIINYYVFYFFNIIFTKLQYKEHLKKNHY